MTQFGKPQPLRSVRFEGKIHKPENLSGVAAVGNFLVIGTDEGNRVQLLRCRDESTYEVVKDGDITLDSSVEEIDVEGIACEASTVYVVGSHAAVRKKVQKGNTVAENRDLLAKIETEQRPGRDRLFRFPLDRSSGALTGEVDQTSLRTFINGDRFLAPFAGLPSKENGVDVEGIAVRDGRLYVGFRGPVLRENHVPVLTCSFDEPPSPDDLLFVNFGGRGFRDLAATKDGFLILAGPVGDGPGSYQLYFWDGRDCLPGVRDPGTPAGRLQLLGDIPTADGAKAEGITVLLETDAFCDVLVLFDGLENGGGQVFWVPKRP